MKRIGAAVLVSAVVLGSTACDSFLDVNDNPNTPEVVSAYLYLPPMLHWLVTSPQFDGRFVGRYTQQWVLPQTSGTTPNIWQRHGYDRPPSDNGGQQWRDVYWTFGQNLVDMMAKAEAEQRWDLLGVGYVLKAWGWQAITDLHGEIIVKEAIDPTKFSFNYDTQEYAYQEIQRLLSEAITNLQRTDGAVDATYLARGDKLYNGDPTKWLKLAHGMLAMNLNHYSNKSTYKPADVIAAVDLSLASNADDAVFIYPGVATDNSDLNFWGRSRGNLASYRQTQFVLELMNGTQFDGVVDPRMSRMLAASPDGQFRGIDPNIGYGALTTAQRPNNLHGYAGTAGLGLPGRYLFDNLSRIPVVTYAQLQFVKAEAALRMGDMATARTAYLNGVSAHIDFVNARNSEIGNPAIAPITAAEKAAFLAAPAIVPAAITLSHIMSQKFLAQWGWGHNEVWMDMRRYHYTDVDPVSGTQVFRGYAIPTNLDTDNSGKPVQRIRPRYNSEYVWNRPGLDAIGGLALDYHTKPLWITER
ncbi:MAG TPA: RagB/SusD family nutrient uptake outer membrane protein [Longimicrobiales bacterium]|nr:RagB/SusD family nutrient uptake outer membrane protein [Longimicrobiales bacterium]